jgi:hypothetical protein
MIADAAHADRNRSVQRAATAWREAGVIDAATWRAIVDRFPDNRVRFNPAIRVVLFVFTFVAGCALWGLLSLAVSFPIACIPLGVACVVATEKAIGDRRLSQGGIEEATAALAILAVTAEIVWQVFDSDGGVGGVRLVLLVLAACAGAAAWRWGMPFWSMVAAGAALLALLQGGDGRTLVLVVCAVAAVLLYGGWRFESPAPRERMIFAAALVVVVGGLYLAVNHLSVEERWLEQVAFGWSDAGPRVAIEALAPVLTVLVPVLLLAVGAWQRDRLLLGLGTLALAASIATLWQVTKPVPAWLALVVSGAATLGGVLALRRWLASGPGGERFGFTDAKRFSGGDRERVLEIAAVLAGLTPKAPAGGPPHGLDAGGGEFGGGGASDRF